MINNNIPPAGFSFKEQLQTINSHIEVLDVTIATINLKIHNDVDHISKQPIINKGKDIVPNPRIENRLPPGNEALCKMKNDLYIANLAKMVLFQKEYERIINESEDVEKIDRLMTKTKEIKEKIIKLAQEHEAFLGQQKILSLKDKEAGEKAISDARKVVKVEQPCVAPQQQQPQSWVAYFASYLGY